MSDSKTIEAAIKLVKARFIVDERGTYYLRNMGNEEHVNSCIGELHRALVTEGHMPKVIDK